jgi:hypothetical protein
MLSCLVCGLAFLCLTAIPDRADAAPSNAILSYPTGTGTTLQVAPPIDGITGLAVTIDASHVCNFGCAPFVYDITSSSGWINDTGGRCTTDGPNPNLIHCGSAFGGRPALTTIGGSPLSDRIEANCVASSDYTATLHATGAGGNDTILGSCGNDVIDSGPGLDIVDARAGEDVIAVRDGDPDAVDCGPSNDSVAADAIDTTTNCEQVDLPASVIPPAPGATVTGQQAKAIKKCKKKLPQGPRRTKCLKKARRLPV